MTRDIRWDDPQNPYRDDEVMTVEEISDALEVDRNSVVRLIDAFNIKKVGEIYLGNPGRPPGAYLVNEEDLENFQGYLDEEAKDTAEEEYFELDSTPAEETATDSISEDSCEHEWEPYRTRVVMDQFMTLQVDAVYCRKCLQVRPVID